MKRLMALVLASGAASVVLPGCQTVDLSRRSLAAKNPAAARCERLEDRRKDCEDEVGCLWDYDSSTCVVSN
jgi:hypothetical protein